MFTNFISSEEYKLWDSNSSSLKYILYLPNSSPFLIGALIGPLYSIATFKYLFFCFFYCFINIII